jgi:hypothetical protein
MNRRAAGVENESSLHQVGSILQHGRRQLRDCSRSYILSAEGRKLLLWGRVRSSTMRRAAHSSLVLAEWAKRHPRRSTGNSGVSREKDLRFT